MLVFTLLRTIMAQKPMIIYRDFVWIEVKQDVDTMLYNATDIAKWYLKSNWKRRDVSDFLSIWVTKDYIKLLKNLNTDKIVFKSKRWKYGWTWMCEELLVDFMMWVSPEFKKRAIEFIINWVKLAWKRWELKEWYKKMWEAIAKSWNANYREEATMINVLCTWSCASNQRERLWIDKMKQMDDMQITNASLIKAWLNLEQRKDILIRSI